jgi:hypothetical protein
MTIYYLCLKTHNKTGLKYLCKTTQKNPNLYSGSGVDWKIHLEENGFDITTEIIKECSSMEEFSYWGRYYSKLWNIVSAMDNYGNKIWANRIPETGGGPGWKTGELNPAKTDKFRQFRSESQLGSDNPKFDHTKYIFEHKITKERIIATQAELIKKTSAPHSNVSNLVNRYGRVKSVQGWKLIN